MVDGYAGITPLDRIGEEVSFWLKHKNPNWMSVQVRKTYSGKYHLTIWIPKKDFKEVKNGNLKRVRNFRTRSS